MSLRQVVLFALLFMVTDFLFSQDYISINNNEKIKVEIREIGSSYMTYTMWNKDDIKYKVNRSDITEVIFDDSMEILFRDTYPTFTNSAVILKSRENGNYLLGGKWVSDFWALEGEFSKTNDAALYFFKAVKQKKSAKVLGVSSLISLGGGFLLAASSDFYDASFAIGIISVVIVGPVLGTIGIITKLNSSSNKKRAEDAYGIRYVHHSEVNDINEIVTLNLEATQNGVGLVLHF